MPTRCIRTRGEGGSPVCSRSGFTLIEAVIVVAILAVLAAVVMPTMVGASADTRLRSTVQEMSAAFGFARSEAIRTGQIHLVFVGTDASGNALPAHNGGPAVVSVVNDGAPGSLDQNCQIDPGEERLSIEPRAGVAGGVMPGVVPMPDDVGLGVIATGSTLTEPDGDPASWVLFRPEGTVHAFDAGCAIGSFGTGAGAIYLNNGRMQFGYALRPIGNGRARIWERGNARWTN